jgi:hypothetical protein
MVCETRRVCTLKMSPLGYRLSVASVVARPRTGAHYGTHANAGLAEFLKLNVNVKHTLQGGGSVLINQILTFLCLIFAIFGSLFVFLWYFRFARFRFASDFQLFASKRNTRKNGFFSLRSEINFAQFSHRFASTENERRPLVMSINTVYCR